MVRALSTSFCTPFLYIPSGVGSIWPTGWGTPSKGVYKGFFIPYSGESMNTTKLLPSDSKTCSICGLVKTRADFPMYKTGPWAGQVSGGKCKPCYAEHVRAKRGSLWGHGAISRVSPEQKAQFIDLYTNHNKTPRQIGTMFGFKSGDTVKYHLKAAGISIKPASAWITTFGGSIKLSPENRKKKDRATKSKHKAARKKRVQAYARTFLEKGCVDCGYSNIIALDFDHRVPEDKKTEVGKIINRGSLNQVITEIAKCDVVCKNCHAIRTANMFGSWRLS